MRLIQIGVVLTAAVVIIATAVKSQVPERAAQAWEYSSVTGSPVTNNARSAGINSMIYTSSATICYAAVQACRIEEVTKDVDERGKGGEALMMATAKLGEQGWELTTSTEVEAKRVERVLYFRRLKSTSK